jgi:hypothetical protein
MEFVYEPIDAETKQKKFIKDNSFDHQLNLNSEETYEAIYKTQENQQKARPQLMRTVDLISDEEILNSVSVAINSFFCRRFTKQKKKNKDLTIDMFISEHQKSTSSLPSVIPQVKKTLESKIP